MIMAMDGRRRGHSFFVLLFFFFWEDGKQNKFVFSILGHNSSTENNLFPPTSFYRRKAKILDHFFCFLIFYNAYSKMQNTKLKMKPNRLQGFLTTWALLGVEVSMGYFRMYISRKIETNVLGP